MVEDDIFAEAEIPAGWGLLVRADDELRLARPPAKLSPSPEQRRSLLEGIALAASAVAARAMVSSETPPEES